MLFVKISDFLNFLILESTMC